MNEDLWRNIQRQMETYRRLMEGPYSSIERYREHIENIQSQAQLFADRFTVPSLPDVAATLGLSRSVLEKLANPNAVTEMQRVFAEQQRSLDRLPIRTLLLTPRDFRSEILTASTHVAMAQTTFGTLNLERAGGLIRIEQAQQDEIRLLTERLSLSHADLVASLTRPEGLLATVPPFVSELPATDLLIHGAAVRTITPHEEYEQPGQAQIHESARLTIASETEAFLEVTLLELKPAFAEQYAGAKSRSRERGPDWWAHWGTSMRRLMKGVLHTVAHDDLVLPWAKQNNKELDPNGHPTRGTKIEWLCLHIKNDKYRHFVRNELDSALALIGVLDSTQHVDEFPEIEQMFNWTELRAEFALRQILTIWKNREAN